MKIAIRPRTAARFDVVGLGTGTLDRFCLLSRPPAPDAKQRVVHHGVQPGGQVPTALVALQRWGLRTAYAGVLAGDEGGRLQTQSLQREGVDVGACLQRPDATSRSSVILIDEVSGARTVLWNPPAGAEIGAADLRREPFANARAVLLDADDAGAALAAAEWAKEAGALVMLDVDEPGAHVRDLLAHSDVAIVPAAFARRLTALDDLRAALGAMRRLGPALVAVTLGAGGALARDAGGFHYADAFPVAVVDTTSAGDLFHAGMLFALLEGWEVPRALRFASAAAALECTALGGRAAIPSLDEVSALAR